MPKTSIAKYLNPWKFKREEKQKRFQALRERDGDACWRCRRQMRFDLPRGHDLAPTIEHFRLESKADAGDLENFCLCHGRCNRLMADATPEVKERVRLKSEAELFARARKSRAA